MTNYASVTLNKCKARTGETRAFHLNLKGNETVERLADFSSDAFLGITVTYAIKLFFIISFFLLSRGIVFFFFSDIRDRFNLFSFTEKGGRVTI